MKMLSGTIENASAGDGGAANGGGGAVYVAGGELILAGGEIKNSYNSKGAVYATGGKITLTNDVRITDNGGKNICLKD